MNTRLALVLSSLLVASSVAAQRMIACDSGRRVYEVDTTTGAKTQIGLLSSNVSTSAGFAYDWINGKLYVTSTSNDALYIVDMSSWEAQLIGTYGVPVVPHGLEIDVLSGQLYMAGNSGDFYTVDKLTGQATLVGMTGQTSFQNLGHDWINDVLYMTNSGTPESLHIVDRTTGATTLVGPLGAVSTNPNSMAFDGDNNVMYLADNSQDNLYTLDLTTGAATVVGSMGSGNVLGLAYIPGTGSWARSAHGCGSTTLFATGVPNAGGQVEFEVGNATGFPFVGFGLSNLGLPFCGCTVGHEWTVAIPGSSVSFTLPLNALGVDLYVQATDFLGSGGCTNPMLTLTDTVTITIGA